MKSIISGTINNNTIISKRESGTVDVIPIDSLLMNGTKCQLTGTFRSENTPDRHVKLYFHVEEIEPYTYDVDVNSIEFDGYICKTPISRTTPLGRHITDFLIAVNETPFESSYLPCVAWKEYDNFKIGDYVHAIGRIQSRTYHGDKIAYEISLKEIFVKK